jgi:hypothetical protein
LSWIWRLEGAAGGLGGKAAWGRYGDGKLVVRFGELLGFPCLVSVSGDGVKDVAFRLLFHGLVISWYIMRKVTIIGSLSFCECLFLKLSLFALFSRNVPEWSSKVSSLLSGGQGCS